MSPELSAQFDAYRAQYPDYAFLHEPNALERHPDFASGKIDWDRTAPFNFYNVQSKPDLTPYELAVGKVLYDILCLLIGGEGIWRNLDRTILVPFAAETIPQQRLISTYLPRLRDPATTNGDKAVIILRMVLVINGSGLLTSLYAAFKGTLLQPYSLFYATSGLLTLFKLTQRSVHRAPPEILLALATALRLWIDIAAIPEEGIRDISAGDGTSATDHQADEPSPYEDSLLTPNIALRTPSGKYVTFISGGGYGGESISNTVVQTDRRTAGDWEKFTLVKAGGPDTNRYYINTHNGPTMYAYEQGDKTGPGDTRCPIHTDANEIGLNQKIIVIANNDGTVSFMTRYGFFLTAMQGGGVPHTSDYDTIATDGDKIGHWFDFEPVTED